MNCNEARQLLAAHLDGELDVVRDAEIVDHLDGCQACADQALAHAASRGLVRDKLSRFNAPAGLDAQIRRSLRKAENIDSVSKFQIFTWRLMPLAAVLMLGTFGGYQWGNFRAQSRIGRDELISSHVRALMSEHLLDVVSTDQHTVKPWFAGKLDFSPPVRDLAAQGFPLVGARIDRIGNRPVAVLVYQRRKHIIDVYVAPADSNLATSTVTQTGFNLAGWTRDDFRCVAVSDLAANELAEFARLLEASAP